MSKVGKWTDAETAEVVKDYDGGNGMSIEAIAEKTGRTKRSVQGKLTSEKVYVVPEKPAAQPRDEGPTKKEILSELVETGVIDTDGADGATKPFLNEVLSLARRVSQAS